MSEASQPFELLMTVLREAPGTLGTQIERQLRQAIRSGGLRAGSRIPSTRDLARQLGVSRRITVDAYAQLAAEGYLQLRQGAHPRVAHGLAVDGTVRPTDGVDDGPPPRFDFRPSRPDVSAFPRGAWARCLRDAVTTITEADLSYGDPCGVGLLRTALADHLGRVRGVVADPRRVVVTNGYLQGLGLVCAALAARGTKRLALEDPSSPEEALIAGRVGLEIVSVPVDEGGLRVDALKRSGAGAVVLTPAHQHPTGVVLAPDRRTALVAWLRERDAVAIEDDYDAEYRYDRAAVGALQGLAPERVVYAGTASKVLAPALRIGWLVVPDGLFDAVRHEKLIADQGSARIEQHAFAAFLARGDLDRHLRRMRIRYRAQRDALVAALANELPEATVAGIAAGLHATVELPPSDDPAAIRAEARRRRVELYTLDDYRTEGPTSAATLFLGYGQVPEAAMRAGVRELADAIRTTRA